MDIGEFKTMVITNMIENNRNKIASLIFYQGIEEMKWKIKTTTEVHTKIVVMYLLLLNNFCNFQFFLQFFLYLKEAIICYDLS